MGILDTYTNSNFGKSDSIGGGGSFGYSSINEVRRAYDEGKLSYNAAYRILMDQFGLSDLDIQDVLVIEPPQFDDDVPLDPGLDDAIDQEVIPDTSPDTVDTDTSIPMTDNQRFLFLGVVVAAALFGFIKK
jgi:hypothetical protein